MSFDFNPPLTDALAETLKRRAARHQKPLGPPLEEADIAAFEAEHRCTLSEDYRWFLTRVGNGGPGPGRGLNPLARTIRIFMLDLHASYRPANPFPHSTYFRMLNLPDEPPSVEAEGVTEDDDDFIDLSDAWLIQNAGRLSLANDARTNLEEYHHVLVLNGPRRGEVWHQTMPCGPVRPLDPETGRSPQFLSWYLTWLDPDQPLWHRWFAQT